MSLTKLEPTIRTICAEVVGVLKNVIRDEFRKLKARQGYRWRKQLKAKMCSVRENADIMENKFRVAEDTYCEDIAVLSIEVKKKTELLEMVEKKLEIVQQELETLKEYQVDIVKYLDQISVGDADVETKKPHRNSTPVSQSLLSTFRQFILPDVFVEKPSIPISESVILENDPQYLGRVAVTLDHQIGLKSNIPHHALTTTSIPNTSLDITNLSAEIIQDQRSTKNLKRKHRTRKKSKV